MNARDDALEPDEGEPLAAIRPGKLRDVDASDLVGRFVFGACASTIAAVIGIRNTTAGGMFLAFPAILPATLTLLEQKSGIEAARHDLRGAVLGSLGLVAFAIAAALLFTDEPVPVVLGVAIAAWIVVAVGCYLATARLRRFMHDRPHTPFVV